MHWVFAAARRLSLVVMRGLVSSCAWSSHCRDVSCGAWALGWKHYFLVNKNCDLRGFMVKDSYLSSVLTLLDNKFDL